MLTQQKLIPGYQIGRNKSFQVKNSNIKIMFKPIQINTGESLGKIESPFLVKMINLLKYSF